MPASLRSMCLHPWLCSFAIAAMAPTSAATVPMPESGTVWPELLAANETQPNVTEQGEALRARGRQVQVFYSGMPRRDYQGGVIPAGLCSNKDFDPLNPGANGGCNLSYFMVRLRSIFAAPPSPPTNLTCHRCRACCRGWPCSRRLAWLPVCCVWSG
jgi:hypothetical protein